MKKIVVSLLVLGVVAAGLAAFVHPTAFMNYISYKGSKQGQLKGASGKSGREKDGWFNVIAFDMGSEKPIDATVSAASGKRQHSPITITREVDAATPLLMQALSTNELFETVTIQTFNDNKPSKTVTLYNAVLTSVHKDPASAHKELTSVNKDGAIEISMFTYDRLTMTN